MLVTAAAGCAGPGGSAGPAAGADPQPPDRAPVLLRSADLRLPLDDYSLSLADVGRLARGNRALLRQCMRELGVDYSPPEPGPRAGPLTWNERRYGLTEPAQAAHGYWPQSRAAAASAAAARVARRNAPAAPAAEGAALTGRGAAVVNGRRVPPGGCTAEAHRRLTAHDPPAADTSLPQRLSAESYFGSQQDAPVRAALRRWAACMRAAGHPYAGPLDPPEDQRFQHAVSAVEIATAEADVACKQRANLVGVWFTAESARQRSLVGANRAGLELARTAFRAELAVAAAAGA